MVEPGYNGPKYDIAEFETLSDREQEVFLQAVNDTGSWIETDRDINLPGAVTYQNTTYSVGNAHVDGCGRPLGDFLVWGAFVMGMGLLITGAFLRQRA